MLRPVLGLAGFAPAGSGRGGGAQAFPITKPLRAQWDALTGGPSFPASFGDDREDKISYPRLSDALEQKRDCHRTSGRLSKFADVGDG